MCARPALRMTSKQCTPSGGPACEDKQSSRGLQGAVTHCMYRAEEDIRIKAVAAGKCLQAKPLWGFTPDASVQTCLISNLTLMFCPRKLLFDSAYGPAAFGKWWWPLPWCAFPGCYPGSRDSRPVQQRPLQPPPGRILPVSAPCGDSSAHHDASLRLSSHTATLAVPMHAFDTFALTFRVVRCMEMEWGPPQRSCLSRPSSPHPAESAAIEKQLDIRLRQRYTGIAITGVGARAHAVHLQALSVNPVGIGRGFLQDDYQGELSGVDPPQAQWVGVVGLQGCSLQCQAAADLLAVRRRDGGCCDAQHDLLELNSVDQVPRGRPSKDWLLLELGFLCRPPM